MLTVFVCTPLPTILLSSKRNIYLYHWARKDSDSKRLKIFKSPSPYEKKKKEKRKGLKANTWRPCNIVYAVSAQWSRISKMSLRRTLSRITKILLDWNSIFPCTKKWNYDYGNKIHYGTYSMKWQTPSLPTVEFIKRCENKQNIVWHVSTYILRTCTYIILWVLILYHLKKHTQVVFEFGKKRR